jgi:hypothetical protein
MYMEQMMETLKKQLKKKKKKPKTFKAVKRVSELKPFQTEDQEEILEAYEQVKNYIKRSKSFDLRSKIGKVQSVKVLMQYLDTKKLPYSVEEVFDVIQADPKLMSLVKESLKVTPQKEKFVEEVLETPPPKKSKKKLKIAEEEREMEPEEMEGFGRTKFVKNLGFAKVVLEEPMNTNEL